MRSVKLHRQIFSTGLHTAVIVPHLFEKGYIEIEHLVWQRLDELGIVPGTSLYFQGKRVRKTQPATGFDVACKWKRNYGAWQVDEAWFILTDLGSLRAALDAYKQRMGIEEMFP